MNAIGSHNYPGRSPADAALLDLDAITRIALANGATTYGTVQAFANALTGEINGYRSRALTRAIVDAYDAIADVPLADLKAAEVNK